MVGLDRYSLLLYFGTQLAIIAVTKIGRAAKRRNIFPNCTKRSVAQAACLCTSNYCRISTNFRECMKKLLGVCNRDVLQLSPNIGFVEVVKRLLVIITYAFRNNEGNLEKS